MHGHHPRELVGLGEKISFKRTRVGRDIGNQASIGFSGLEEIVGGAQSGLFHGAGDIEHGEAFGNDDGVKIDVAATKSLLDVDDVGRFVEEIFAGLQRASMMVVVPQDEGFLALDHSGIFQFGGNAAGGISGAQHNDCLRARGDRG